MFAATQPSSFFAVPPTSRLRWLVSLRWLALVGVAMGLAVATAARRGWGNRIVGTSSKAVADRVNADRTRARHCV